MLRGMWAGGLVLLFAAAPAAPAEPPWETTCLKWIPADAVYFEAALRNRARIEQLTQSRAGEALLADPAVNALAGSLGTVSIDGLALAKPFFEGQQGTGAHGLLLETLSDECFVYAGPDAAEALALLGEVRAARRTARERALLAGENPESAAGEAMLARFENADKRLVVPRMVVGGKVRDAERTRRLLTTWAHALADRLAREPVPGLTLSQRTMRGETFHIARFRLAEMAPLFASADFPLQTPGPSAWNESVAATEFEIAMGLLGDYLVLAIDDSADFLEAWADAPKLIEEPKLARLADFADKPLTEISFSRGAWRNAAADRPFAMRCLGAAIEFTSDAEAALRWIALRDAVAQWLEGPQAAAVQGDLLTVGFLTKTGSEAYAWDWTVSPAEPRTLELLGRLGPEPLAFAVTGNPKSPRSVEMLRSAEAVLEVWRHAAAEDTWSPMAELLRIAERAAPELRKAMEARGNIGVTETAWVFAAGDAAPRWQRDLPAAEKPLPMGEAAWLCRGQAAREWAAVGSEAQAALAAADGSFSEVRQRSFPAGTIGFVVNDPRQSGWERQLALNVGQSSDGETIIASYVPKFTLRLLQRREPNLPGPLADWQRPLLDARYCHLGRLAEALRPWTHYGLSQSPRLEADWNRDALSRLADRVLDLLAAQGEFASATYREGDVTVTHTVRQALEPLPVTSARSSAVRRRGDH